MGLVEGQPSAGSIFLFYEKEDAYMRKIRNSDARLVCCLDDETGTVEIRIKDCTTLIKRNLDGTNEVVNTKSSTAK
jgi:hypothetical protein